MAILARASNENFVTQSNSTGNNADAINDTHTINDRLMIADFHWYADTSCAVTLRIGGDANKAVTLLSESAENSGAALAGTWLSPNDTIVIALAGTTYKGYRLILAPWKDFYTGA